MNTLTAQIDSPLAQAVVESNQKLRPFARKFGRRIAPTVLEIVVLFDEDGAREAGVSLCHRVLAQLGPRYAIHLLPWDLSVTQFPILTDIVARETMWSPFFLVTVSGKEAITPEVEAFIRRCAEVMHRSKAALVAQLHGIARNQLKSSPAYQCLKRIADDSQIPVFSTAVELDRSRGAGRASPNRSGSPFVASPPQTLPKSS